MNRSDLVFATICSWDRNNPENSLDLMYQCALDDGQGIVKWYTAKRRWKRALATLMRAITIVIGTLGALGLVVNAAWPAAATALAFPFGDAGIVLVAIAAAVAGLDKFLGLSSGWIRFVSTQLAVERTIKELQYDWAILQLVAASPATPDQANTMVSRLRQFESSLALLVEQEIKSWAAEFQRGLADFQATLSAIRIVPAHPATVNAIVTNGAEFGEVTLKIDDKHVHVLKGSTAHTFSVESGAHALTARAERNGMPYVGHAAFTAGANSVEVMVELRPIPGPPPDGPMLDGILWSDMVSDDRDILVKP